MFAIPREGRSPAESLPGSCRLVRPGAAPERGTARPRRYRGQKCVHDTCTNAGGTAEGLPFVPMGGRGAFFFSAATSTGKSITS